MPGLWGAGSATRSLALGIQAREGPEKKAPSTHCIVPTKPSLALKKKSRTPNWAEYSQEL